MNKFLLSFLLLATSAFAQVAFDVSIQQVSDDGTKFEEKIISPSANQVLGFDANKHLVAKSATAGSGDVTGPDGGVGISELPTFSDTTGKVLKGGTGVTLSNGVFSTIASNGNLTLSPNGTGLINFGPSGSFGSISSRILGDNLPQSFPVSGTPGVLTIKNSTTGAFTAVSEYEFGQLIAFSNPRGTPPDTSSILEFWGSYDGSNWQPTFTLLAGPELNTVQIRASDDTNSLMLQYDDTLGGFIKTEFGSSPLTISPLGSLTLSPGSTIILQAGGSNQDIELIPSGTGQVRINDGTSSKPSFRFQSSNSGLFRSGSALGISSNGIFAGSIDTNTGSGGLYIAAGGSNQNIRLVPSGTGVVQTTSSLVTPATSLSTHVSLDGLPASFPVSGTAGTVQVLNTVTSDTATLSQYEFGHMLAFKNSRGTPPNTTATFEFFGNHDGTNWQPVVTMLAEPELNTLEVRASDDTNSIYLQFDDTLGGFIKTEVASTPLTIFPSGNLTITSGDTIFIQAGGSDKDIEITPSGSGQVRLNDGSSAKPSIRFQSSNTGIYRSGDAVAVSSAGVAAGTFQADSGTGGLFISASGTNENIRLAPAGTGIVQALSQIDSTSTTEASSSGPTGSITTTGGIYAAKKIMTESQLVSNITTGTPPIVVASTTNVPNLNASTVNGNTFSNPGTIGGGTPGAATFTTITTSGDVELGNSSDTTLHRSTAGTVTIEGKTILTAGASFTADAASAPVYAADAGSTDDYAITLSPVPSSYTTGTFYRFKANTANTGSATLNINSLGAKTIKKLAGAITTDLADNDIRAGQMVVVIYDGTNMQMMSQLGNATGGSSGVYTLCGSTGSTTSPADATTYYFGSNGRQLNTAQGSAKIYFPATGTITKIEVWWFAGTAAGSNESFTAYFQLNGTTDTSIASVSDTNAGKRFSNLSLSIAVSAGDYGEIKIIAPTWGTNPTGVLCGYSIYVTL